MTASVILPFDTFGSHLNPANKTIDVDLERKNFEAAGKSLADIFNEGEIDGYLVISEFVAHSSEEVQNDITEEWKTAHVIQSQYTCQIVKCLNSECCSPFRTNYCTIFPDRFLPPAIPIKSCSGGLKVDATGHFGSLFQALHFQNVESMKASCFDENCPSLNKKDPSGVTTLQKRKCPHYSKYHSTSTIKSMKAHKRVCHANKMCEPEHENEHEENYDEDDGHDNEEEMNLPSNGRNIFETINAAYNL
ncbi:hypothetical protein PoB_003121500 [Plakobranchus ocellatus]|uniref:Uncharacterized protein n=1 Tax=Plakobranchus ocellatus TaxID=259542 RepID=A0AAV4ACZ9_9GAST|nr:hypothetical protein PoB_003121500 [Plakobranchus ocellatus]